MHSIAKIYSSTHFVAISQAILYLFEHKIQLFEQIRSISFLEIQFYQIDGISKEDFQRISKIDY